MRITIPRFPGGFRLKVCKVTPKVNDIGRGIGYSIQSGLSCPYKTSFRKKQTFGFSAMSPIE